MRFPTQLSFLTLAGLLLAGPVILAQQSPAGETPSDFLRRSGVQLTLDRIPITNVDVGTNPTRLNLSLFRETDLRPGWSLRGEAGVSLFGSTQQLAMSTEDVRLRRATPFAALELRTYRTPRTPGKARTFLAWRNAIQVRQGLSITGGDAWGPIEHPLEFRTGLVVGQSKDLGDRGFLEYGAGAELYLRSYGNGNTTTGWTPTVHLRYGFHKR